MTPKPKHTPDAQLPRRKLMAFRLVLLLTPVVLLAILELSLRIFGYGPEFPLVIRTQKAGKEFFSLNREVGRRYFRQPGAVVPEPSEEHFSVEKGSKTKRIFCLGESTIAGFPYEFNATAPAFLRQRLSALLPEYEIEVINVGLSAVGSYVIADFAEELLDYQPDLFIIYSGHNEFYGAFGSASTVGIGGNPALTRIYLGLSTLKVFMLLRDGLDWVAGLFRSSDGQRGETLMAEVVADQEIPYGSSEYWQTLDAFDGNLRRIIRQAAERGVPVLVSGLVSNVRTHQPFRSAFLPTTPVADRARALSLVARGDSLLSLSEIQPAIASYEQARRIDSSHALLLFKMGSAYLKSGAARRAGYYFDQARDYDLLRFRASREFIERLRQICTEEGARFSPLDSAFVANSPGGLIGQELMTEHLHPNIVGHFLMAKTYAGTIRQSGLLAPPSSWDTHDDIDSVVRARSHVTAFDTLMGEMKVALMTHRWPFVERSGSFAITPRSKVEEIVYRYVRREAAWSDSRYDLAEYYASVRRYREAREECLAVFNVIPFSYEPLLRVGDYYEDEGLTSEAETTYRRSYGIQDNSFARIRLSILLLQQERPAEALPELERALALSPGVLTPQQHAFLLYLHGIAHAKLGNLVQARKQAESALRYDPRSTEAKELLGQLDRVK